VNVVAHEVELVHVVRGGGVHSDLGGRQREDEPAVPGVCERVPENIAEERAVCLRVLAVDDDVRAVDHAPEANRLSGASGAN